MKKLLNITRCGQCYFNYEEFDERSDAYKIYCIHPGVHQKEITTPLNTIPDWCELPDAEEK